MRTKIGCVAILAGMMGVATDAAAAGENNASLAEKRGLSPIVVPLLSSPIVMSPIVILSPIVIAEIREATNKAWVLGNDRFKQRIQAKLDRRVEPKHKGGDRKSEKFRINRV